MKDWREKYPKTWEKFRKYYLNAEGIVYIYCEGGATFDSLFGHLLKFFSENGIEIERYVEAKDIITYCTTFWYERGGYYKNTGNFNTAIEACEKALEIREGKK